MLLGLAWFAYYQQRTDILEQVLRYGRANNYVMGEGPLSRTYMTPSLQATYARALHAWGGKKFEPEHYYPQVYSSGLSDYQAHLQVLGILLHARIDGGIDAGQMARLKEHHERAGGRNPLFSFAYHSFSDGDLSGAIHALLDDPAWPADRLPTSADRCSPWVIERDVGKSWEPCDEGRTHSGGDLIFVTRLIGDYYDVP